MNDFDEHIPSHIYTCESISSASSEENNNITINVVGCEDVKHLMDHPAITKTLKLLYNGNDQKAVVAMGQAVYNDDAHPENKTIVFRDDRQGSAKVSQGNGNWGKMRKTDIRNMLATKIRNWFVESNCELRLNEFSLQEAVKSLIEEAATPMDDELSSG